MGLEIGLLNVRRSTFIRAKPPRVWEEFTSFERLAAWFGTGHRLEHYEPRVGGRIGLSVELEGERRRFGGVVLVFEAAQELSFSEDWEIGGEPEPAFVTIRLSSILDGCHVELFHHGFERCGLKAALDLEGHEEGWSVQHLKALRQIVEG